MATFNVRGFASPGTLRNIHPRFLLEFIRRFAPYLERRGLATGTEAIDYDRLAGILISPDEDIPTGLVDALYLIHEMATDEGMDSLLSANAELERGDQIDFGQSAELAPADVALRVWLQLPELLDRKHSERFVTGRRSFEYFASEEIPEDFEMPSPRDLRSVEKEMAEWFNEKRKGDVVRVFAYHRPDAVWFLVRHGGTFRREGAVKDGESSSVFYRPEEHDVVAYEPALGELRINANGNKGETDLVRRSFGRHIFGDENHFPTSTKKYDLEPLRRDGVESLTCSDIVGLDEVVLTEVVYYWGGAHGEMEIRRAKDLFAALEEKQRKIAGARITGARFKITFTDAKTARSVQIRPPNVASYTRDDDGPRVEEWLMARGFAAKRKRNGDARA